MISGASLLIKRKASKIPRPDKKASMEMDLSKKYSLATSINLRSKKDFPWAETRDDISESAGSASKEKKSYQ